MRVQIQLRIITDDENVLSDDVIACFENLFADEACQPVLTGMLL
jgi:hypothetical protein